MSVNSFNVPSPPTVSGPVGPDTMIAFGEYVIREFRKRTPDGTAVGSTLLVSPNGSVYAVQVDDDGNLFTTKVRG